MTIVALSFALCRTFAAHTCATSLPAAVCGLGWCSMLRGNYKANTTLTVLNLLCNSVGENGTIALAAALKATVVTCGHEFREDALVWSSPIKLKQLMLVFNCFSCCFMCLKGTAHQDVRHRCAAPMYLVNVARATTNQWNSRPIFFGHVSQATVCQGGAEM